METYKRMVEIMFGFVKETDKSEVNYLFKGCSLDDKCLCFYTNDDNVIFNDYTTNRIINLFYDGATSLCNDLYNEAGIDYGDYQWYKDYEKEIMKEENIKFAV